MFSFHYIKNLYLRLIKGAGCCDIFSLDYYLAKKIIKPLKEFRCHIFSHPSDLNSLEEWLEILNKMIWSFEFLLRDEDWDKDISSDERIELMKKEQEGFELFGKYFRSLWL